MFYYSYYCTNKIENITELNAQDKHNQTIIKHFKEPIQIHHALGWGIPKPSTNTRPTPGQQTEWKTVYEITGQKSITRDMSKHRYKCAWGICMSNRLMECCSTAAPKTENSA